MSFWCFKGRNVFLYTACVIANLGSFIIGCAFTWTPIALPILDGRILNNYNPIGYENTITSAQKAWITSLMPFGAILTPLASWYLSEKRGRKEVIVIGTLFTCLGFTAMYFAGSVPSICFGRFMTGLGVGQLFTVLPIYLGEISQDTNRGLLSMMMGVFIMLGVLFTYILGNLISLRELNLLLVLIPFIFLMIIDWWLPESPYWLLSKESYKDAESTLRKIRLPINESLFNELAEMQRYLDEFYMHRTYYRNILFKKNILKGIFIVCGLVVLQQMTAVNIIIYFTQPIFEVNTIDYQLNISGIIISLLQFLVCLLASLLIDRFGRKFLLLLSSMGCGLSLIILGVYYKLITNHENLNWLSIVGIVAFTLFYSIGLGPIPFVFLSEIFPQYVKTVALTIIICVCLIFAFCWNSLFPILCSVLGIALTLWLLAVFCFIGGILIYFFVPEIKGKTFRNVQEILKR